jgi:hypothetical protein
VAPFEECAILHRLLPQYSAPNFRIVWLRERVMAIPKSDKHKEYVRYASHCLDILPTISDQEFRTIQREMAAEWLKLADAIAHPLKPKK